MVKELAKSYGVVLGLSNLAMGSTLPTIAKYFNTKIIEKHFILNHTIGGPDASFSMDEQEFNAMVKAVREAEKAIGLVDYSLPDKQKKGKDFSRSLYVVEDIKKGDVITEKNVRSIRPGFGLHPKHLKDILGKEIVVNVEKGEKFSLNFIKK